MSYIDYLEGLSKKQLMVLLARQRQEAAGPVAVVGMGCRLPGGIGDPAALWAAVREGRVVPTTGTGPPVDSLGRPRWNLAAPDLKPLARLLLNGAYLDDIDLFDAAYFGISDNEALHMDPQQRVLLEVTTAALADAGRSTPTLRGATVGVFAAAGPVEYPYARFRNGTSDWSATMAIGNAASSQAGRIGHALGVRGPALSIDSASSSMLTAVHLACQALRRRECDLAIAGACSLLLSPFSFGILDAAGMLSPSGRCQPFTSAADGHVRAEGCGAVVLKRYADAVADCDRPYAVIRGSAVHQVGERPGLGLATPAGYRETIERAIRDADVDPGAVAYVEAQANGSKLGGILEAESTAAAYRGAADGGRPAADHAPLYLGSCKSNLGYLEHASGAPALLKAVLAVAHDEIPPQPGATSPDPDVPWEPLGLRLADSVLPWPPGERRLAGVTGFGFSGTAAHVIISSVPGEAGVPTRPAATGPALARQSYWPEEDLWS